MFSIPSIAIVKNLGDAIKDVKMLFFGVFVFECFIFNGGGDTRAIYGTWQVYKYDVDDR